jgi:hypothetical protein
VNEFDESPPVALSGIAGAKSYLDLLSLDALQQRIAEYEVLSAANSAPDEIWKQLLDVVSIDHEVSFAMPLNIRNVPAGTVLFRGRKITEPSDMSTIGDAWEPPPHQASVGRLNTVNESILYTSKAPPTAFFETRVQPGDLFAMMGFTANVGFPATLIAAPDPDPDLTPMQQQKIAALYQFMEDIFTQKSGPDPSHTYRAPEAMVKIFFDYAPDITRAWMYRSLADPSGSGANLAFRPSEGHDLLTLQQVNICRCRSVDDTDKPIRFDTLEVRFPDPATGRLVTVWRP